MIDNVKVAIGIHPGWDVAAIENELSRDEGIPSIVMIFAGSKARFIDNTIQGLGVAGIRLAGKLHAAGNEYVSPKPRQGGSPSHGIWELSGSSLFEIDNTFQDCCTEVQIDGIK